MIFVLFVHLSADGQIKKEHIKYNESEMENSNYITLNAFDEWLKVNDHYETFVKAYNSSPSHPMVKKMKCLYELESLQGEDNVMSYDEMQQHCSNQS